jgi:aspartyl-tRNA(Asn)/glutamyl-tRNA(Gln) amidotransferase subunit A
MMMASRTEGFGAEVKKRIMLGTYVLSSGYYDAYYKKAMQVRTLIRRDFEEAFTKCDLLLAPTSPIVAYPLDGKMDPLAVYLLDVCTIPVNLAGLPGNLRTGRLCRRTAGRHAADWQASGRGNHTACRLYLRAGT